MDILGKKTQVLTVDPFADQRDTSPFGPVVLNIQIRQRGVTIAAPCGVGMPIVGKDVSPHAFLLANAVAEKFVVDWVTVVSAFGDKEINLWVERGKSLGSMGVPGPTYRALQEIIDTRGAKNPDVQYQ